MMWLKIKSFESSLDPPLENKNRFSWQHLSQRGTRSEQPSTFYPGFVPLLTADKI